MQSSQAEGGQTGTEKEARQKNKAGRDTEEEGGREGGKEELREKKIQLSSFVHVSSLSLKFIPQSLVL